MSLSHKANSNKNYNVLISQSCPAELTVFVDPFIWLSSSCPSLSKSKKSSHQILLFPSQWPQWKETPCPGTDMVQNWTTKGQLRSKITLAKFCLTLQTCQTNYVQSRSWKESHLNIFVVFRSGQFIILQFIKYRIY